MKIFKNNSNNNFEHQKKFPRTKKTDFLYKILLASKANEQGSGLVFAFAVGFLLLILGTASIVTSGQNNTNAVVNEKANQVQAITDAGKKRFESFIATNPKYAQYGKIDVIPIPKNPLKASWNLVSNEGEPLVESYTSTTDSNKTCSAILTENGVDKDSTQNLDILDPQAINSSNFKQGGFEVTDYKLYENANETGLIDFGTLSEYETKIEELKNDGTTGSPFAYAVVEIQGTVNPNATDTDSIFAGNNLSKNKLKITIPLIRRDPNEIPFPGLWVGGPQSNMGSTNQKINADIMISDTGTISDCDNLTLDILAGNSVIINDQSFPTLPSQPKVDDPTNGVYTKYKLEGTNDNKPAEEYTYEDYVLGDKDIKLPRPETTITYTDSDGNKVTETIPADVPDAKGIYHYSVGSIETSGSTTITITPGEKVRIYVSGDINMGGSGGINYNCIATAGCKVEDFHIYGYAPPSTPPPELYINGGTGSQGFIFAPNYELGVSGGSGTNFYGSLWVKGVNDASSSKKIIVTEAITDWSAFPASYQPQNIPAKIGNPTSIERIEAN